MSQMKTASKVRASEAAKTKNTTSTERLPRAARANKSAPDVDKPEPTPPNFEAIARCLDAPMKEIIGGEVKRWVMWKYEWDGNKWTKVPYQADGEHKASTTDEATWSSLATAQVAYMLGEFGGVGIVLGKLRDGVWLAGVDLDSAPAVDTYGADLRAGAGAGYVERSAGGKGLHALCIEVEPKEGKKRDDVEIYNGGSGGRYFTLTGEPPPGEELQPITTGSFDPLRTRMGFPLTMDGDADGYEFPDEPRGPLDEKDLTADERAMLKELRNVPQAAEIYDKGAMRGATESERDYALVARIAIECNTRDPSVINRLARASACYRPKWDSPRPVGNRKRSWIGTTIAKMLKKEQVFDPIVKDADFLVDILGCPRKNDEPVCLEDFVAFLPAHQYIFVRTREIWVSTGVDQRVPRPSAKQSPSRWLDQHRRVDAMTWAPGEPMLIQDELILKEGGRIKSPGCTTFNLYRPPTLQHGDPTAAKPWLDHVRLVFKDTADHIIKWLAHRVQRPQEKINHALVLGGAQGIGKDMLLKPAKSAVGDWNFAEVSPTQLLGRFNGFVRSVILRVSEGRDLGETNRYAFYEHLKTYTAEPPDVHRCDEKHLREYAVVNVCGVIITTNYKTDGLYLPADDRRHFIAWSDKSKDDFSTDYWNRLDDWYKNGGNGHVAAYLATLNLGDFDAKAPPQKTEAWHQIVNASRTPEDAELADVLDSMGRPAAVTLAQLASTATKLQRTDFVAFLRERKNRGAIRHRLEGADYTSVRNPDDRRDGLWVIKGQRQAVYARNDLVPRDQIVAVQRLRDSARGAR